MKLHCCSSSSTRRYRNIKERDRRSHMKDLLSRLSRLMPPHPSKVSVVELLDQATEYVKHLERKIEAKKQTIGLLRGNQTNVNSGSTVVAPAITIREIDSVLELNLITGSNKNFMLYEIIRVLQGEGANVISVSYNNSGDRVIYDIKSQAISPRIGMETSRIGERLRELIF